MEKLYTQAEVDEIVAGFRNREREIAHRIREEQAAEMKALRAQNHELLKYAAGVVSMAPLPPLVIGGVSYNPFVPGRKP